jgi:hypothetical protein
MKEVSEGVYGHVPEQINVILSGPWFHAESRLKNGSRWSGERPYFGVDCKVCGEEISQAYLPGYLDFSGYVWTEKHGTFEKSAELVKEREA